MRRGLKLRLETREQERVADPTAQKSTPGLLADIISDPAIGQARVAHDVRYES
jgi:hypothetical protein